MTHEIDISRAPKGVIAAQRLVEEAAAIGDLGERHYLELKGPPDLSSKKDKAKIAKFILGAANRMPDVAARAFEGYAVMIIGITKDGVVGVPPMEMLELSKVIEPFLGDSGPRWDVSYVPVTESDNVVLVVIVEPPEPGQGAYLCRSNGDGLVDGRVYIRAEGETREATSAEQDRLAQRGRELAASDVDLKVSFERGISPVNLDTDTTLEEYLERTRVRLLDALPKTAPGSAAAYPGLQTTLSKSLLSQMGAFSAEVPEDRTEVQYRAEVSDWEGLVRTAWPRAIQRLLSTILHPVVIRLENRSDMYLEDLEVRIHLEGEVRGLEYDGDRDDQLPSPGRLGFPPPPRRWGPRPNPALAVRMPLAYGHPFTPPPVYTPSRLGWSNSGSVDLTLAAGDLRPQAREVFNEQEVCLVLWAHRTPGPVHGTWEVTTRGHHRRFTGELEVHLAAETDATSALRSILSLDG